MTSVSLPIPTEDIPERLRRFADPNGPAPARMMAARGMVPVKGGDLVLLLVQLTSDSDAAVADMAGETLGGLPENVLYPACTEELPAGVFHELAHRFSNDDQVLARLASNHAVADETVAAIAAHCPERVTEIISINQQRLIGAPVDHRGTLQESKYPNVDRRPNGGARRPTRPRACPGIPMFEELKREVLGQLIPEPSEEPLPSDDAPSRQALAKAMQTKTPIAAGRRRRDRGNQRGVRASAESDPEHERPERRSGWRSSETLRRARFLVRDPNRIVAMAAISSPAMSESEAKNAAQSREICRRRTQIHRQESVNGCGATRSNASSVQQPQDPACDVDGVPIAHLRRNDLQGSLARSRGIPKPAQAGGQTTREAVRLMSLFKKALLIGDSDSLRKQGRCVVRGRRLRARQSSPTKKRSRRVHPKRPRAKRSESKVRECRDGIARARKSTRRRAFIEAGAIDGACRAGTRRRGRGGR